MREVKARVPAKVLELELVNGSRFVDDAAPVDHLEVRGEVV